MTAIKLFFFNAIEIIPYSYALNLGQLRTVQGQ